MLLAKTKPLLKKSFMHSGANALLVFKSIEIVAIEMCDAVTVKKIHLPLYVPVSELMGMMKLSKRQIEKHIV